jgi:glycosyltransferase involved in cell wall biosynthesis
LSDLPLPLVSVIIPCYNKQDTVARAIESVKNQTLNNLECIVVDDGSTDNSEQAILDTIADDRRFRYEHQHNSTVAIARNRGFELSKGLYICCLDGDDAVEPEFLEACVDVLEEDPSIGMTYTRLRWVQPNGTTGISEWPGEWDFDKHLKKQNQVPTCCVVRREVWAKLGGQRKRYCATGAGSEDAEFFLRAGAYGWKGKLATEAPMFVYSWLSGHTAQKGYKEADWLMKHPFVKDSLHPFASYATPTGGRASHAVRQYDEPAVSVVIPVGPGHGDQLWDVLDSLESQTFRKWEAIVVNDTGEPFHHMLYDAYPYVKWSSTDKVGVGAGAARNIGAKRARANFLLFVDADDWIFSDAIDKMINTWKATNAIVYSDYTARTRTDTPEELKQQVDNDPFRTFHAWDGKDMIIGHQSANYDCILAQQQPKLPNPYLWCNITALVPAAWHFEIGGFDEEMPSWEDWDYWIRMAHAGFCFKRIPEELMMYRFYTGERRLQGLQNKENLIAYLKQKYKGIKLMPCGCSDDGSAYQTLLERTGQLYTSNGSKEMADSNFVMIYYDHPNRGQHPVYGQGGRPARKYHYHGRGDIFLVHTDDIRVQPNLFKCDNCRGSFDFRTGRAVCPNCITLGQAPQVKRAPLREPAAVARQQAAPPPPAPNNGRQARIDSRLPVDLGDLNPANPADMVEIERRIKEANLKLAEMVESEASDVESPESEAVPIARAARAPESSVEVPKPKIKRINVKTLPGVSESIAKQMRKQNLTTAETILNMGPVKLAESIKGLGYKKADAIIDAVKEVA